MIDRANDAQFAKSLSVKYEDHFLHVIDDLQLYVLYKYTDVGMAKIKGLPIKNEPKYLTNWKDLEDEKEEESGWSEAIEGKKQKTPEFNTEQFPSLGGPVESSESQSKWAKFKGSSPARKQEKPTTEGNFPALGESFPSLGESYPALGDRSAPEPLVGWAKPAQRKKPAPKKKILTKQDFPSLGGGR